MAQKRSAKRSQIQIAPDPLVEPISAADATPTASGNPKPHDQNPKMRIPVIAAQLPHQSATTTEGAASDGLSHRTSAEDSRPHVHVFGDLAELRLYRENDLVPDHVDPSLAPYRRLRGYIRRVMPGGAWSVAQFVRAGLGDVWKCDTQFRIPVKEVTFPNNPNNQNITDIMVRWDKFRIDEDSNLFVSEANQFPNATVTIGDKVQVNLPEKNLSTDTSFNNDFTVEFGRESTHDFAVGQTDLKVAVGDLTSRLWNVNVNDDWPPSLSLWPRKTRILLAIRFIPEENFNAFLDKCVSEEAQTSNPFEMMWSELGEIPELTDPIEAFFTAKKDDASRLVILIPQNWNKPEDSEPKKEAVRSFGGIAVFRTDRDEWALWSSNCELTEGTSSVTSCRAQFAFESITPTEPDKCTSSLFGFPVPQSFIRLFQPEKRDTKIVSPNAPRAVVTTTQFKERWREENFVQPVWNVDLFENDEGDTKRNVVRLASAEGYSWNDGELQESIAEYRSKGKMLPLGKTNKERKNQQILQAIDWKLRDKHSHGDYRPEWAPSGVVAWPFQHLVIVDLNFGFRRHPGITADSPPRQLVDRFNEAEGKEDNSIEPDWWRPLKKWAEPDAEKRGWIVAILGRQLPLRASDQDTVDHDNWENGDLWELLRFGERPDKNPSSANQRSGHKKTPIFRQRTIVVVSANLLRASGARISRRLSWEHTAVDCLRELERRKWLKPLTNFRHLVVRFGCSGAVLLSQEESDVGKVTTSNLFYDATAKDGFHRDFDGGHVVGSNSCFASRILGELLQVNDPEQSELAVHKGIRQAIVDCQKLYDRGYGERFDENDPYKMDYAAADEVLHMNLD